ncbi:unnamed protein product [Meloidogyne enterolobii]|uniref:Uncharacterized protein n=1 Tax=Meloidogyne enterolobii TaxID=390850 RepID=A0ACB0ZYN4_MELEN
MLVYFSKNFNNLYFSKADFFFKGSSVGISTCCDGSELDADRLLEQKIKDLVDQNDYARIRSLQSISTEDNVFEMCKKVALETNKENDQSTNRKRIRLENDREKERTEELSDLSIVEEDIELDNEERDEDSLNLQNNLM